MPTEAVPRTKSVLPGVRKFHEERAIGVNQTVAFVHKAVVAVPDKKDGLPVEAIAVQDRSEESAVALWHFEGVQTRVVCGGDVLSDHAQEGACIENIYA